MDVGVYVEVWGPDGHRVVALDRDRLTIGKAASNDIALHADRTVSRLHAVIERFPAGFVVRDLGSTNGTFVNGERLLGDRALRSGDEVVVGGARLVYRGVADQTRTEAGPRPPTLTPRERDVLVELCRPVLAGDVFTEPASIRQIATALVVSEAAVKQHLAHLYDKFGIHDDGERRRVRLANAAVRRGAVRVADLQSP